MGLFGAKKLDRSVGNVPWQVMAITRKRMRKESAYLQN
jgi:hypothetical protein